MGRLLLVLAGLVTSMGVPLASPPADLAGTYRLEGHGHVEAKPFPARDAELHADAVLTGGEGDRVHLRLSGQGLSCELDGTIDGAGALSLPRDQRCASDLAGDVWDGRMEARLVSGAGRIRGDELELELSFTVAGEIRMKGGGMLGNLGRRFRLPGTGSGAGADGVPVSGDGEARARGWRDRSRAAAR